ncbi:MAG: cadherin-like beta sandwich domain-containing protein, partial [Clostridia bacterium]|nr:cadherin-like beta sandwich domain-containing protein [Clostridia bacterium]
SKNSNSGGDNGGISASDEQNWVDKGQEWVQSIVRREHLETLGGDDIGSSAEKITVKFKLAEGKYSVTSAIQYAGADKPEKEEKQPDGDGYYTIDADISDNGMDTITVTVETKGKGLFGREITAKKTVYKLSYTKQQLAQLEKIVVESENAVLAPEFSRNTTGYDVVLGENQGTVKITWVKPENVNVTVTDINGKPLEKGVGNTVDVTEADFTVKAEQGTEGDVYKLVLTGNAEPGIAENVYTITVIRKEPAKPTPTPKSTKKSTPTPTSPTPTPTSPTPTTSTPTSPTPTPGEVQTPTPTQTPGEVQTPPQTQTPDTPEPGKPTPTPTPQLTPGTE